ncbi:predicted protein [Histoplasma capsulatum var. duboisii H88]|uniref:26S proteasome complex subunit SEM1 n=3 Tax=Ajellomyces capsulatus TaxID=5037 RepID=C0NJA6_AJECG|nr:uncharacterized protein HCBG_03236 [Histoplasma capsulatum G186AR]EEH07947.1 predicted protein [Histoplasma capsulatum G186AR]EER42914.1 predicted protein [Histoplasma capsulatum H143]EGC42984.1 predicted protein [Histoplasma capsulatum var. duboisii H88]
MSAQATSTQPASQKQPEAVPQSQQQKPAALEEDDEFEDFPVEGTSSFLSPGKRAQQSTSTFWIPQTNSLDSFDIIPPETLLNWPQDEAETTGFASSGDTSSHLWEESWDDDDNNEDFSKQLK